MKETCEEEEASRGTHDIDLGESDRAGGVLSSASMTSEKGLFSCLGMKVIDWEDTS